MIKNHATHIQNFITSSCDKQEENTEQQRLFNNSRERLEMLSKALKFLLCMYQLYIENKESTSGNIIYYPISASEGVEFLSTLIDEEIHRIISTMP